MRHAIAKGEPAGYQPQADFVFILGMHRSGTSCLAGCLKNCGLFLGDVQLQNRYNPRGNHELKAVEHLHDRILANNGGSWQRPPERIETTWVERIRLASIVRTLQQRVPCGVKDPRILFLLDAWMDIAGTYSMIGTYRHPLAVVRSLQSRNNLSYAEGVDLWLRYNQRLIELHRKHPFPLLCFDLTDTDSYCRLVASCAERLGLDPHLEQICDFVSLELQRQSGGQLPVPEQCQETYAYLENHREVL